MSFQKRSLDTARKYKGQFHCKSYLMKNWNEIDMKIVKNCLLSKEEKKQNYSIQLFSNKNSLSEKIPCFLGSVPK